MWCFFVSHRVALALSLDPSGLFLYMKLTIFGDIPSKKNSRQIVRAHGRIFSIPSELHKKWHHDTALKIIQYKPEQPLEQCKIQCTFFPSTKRAGDSSNKWQSIEDLLKDCRFIIDDNWFVLPDIHLVFGGVDKENPRAEIEIETVDNFFDTSK